MSKNIKLDGANLRQEPSCIRCGEHENEQPSGNKVVMYARNCDVTISTEDCSVRLEKKSTHTPPEMVPVKSRNNDVKIKRTSKNYIVQIKIDKDFSFEKSLQKYSGECMLAFHDVLSDYVSIPKEDVPF